MSSSNWNSNTSSIEHSFKLLSVTNDVLNECLVRGYGEINYDSSRPIDGLYYSHIKSKDSIEVTPQTLRLTTYYRDDVISFGRPGYNKSDNEITNTDGRAEIKADTLGKVHLKFESGKPGYNLGYESYKVKKFIVNNGYNTLKDGRYNYLFDTVLGWLHFGDGMSELIIEGYNCINLQTFNLNDYFYVDEHNKIVNPFFKKLNKITFKKCTFDYNYDIASSSLSSIKFDQCKFNPEIRINLHAVKNTLGETILNSVSIIKCENDDSALRPSIELLPLKFLEVNKGDFYIHPNKSTILASSLVEFEGNNTRNQTIPPFRGMVNIEKMSMTNVKDLSFDNELFNSITEVTGQYCIHEIIINGALLTSFAKFTVPEGITLRKLEFDKMKKDKSNDITITDGNHELDKAFINMINWPKRIIVPSIHKTHYKLLVEKTIQKYRYRLEHDMDEFTQQDCMKALTILEGLYSKCQTLSVS